MLTRVLRIFILGCLILFPGRSSAGAADFTPGTRINAGGDNVNALAFSRNGKMLATGHNSEVVRLWSLPDGKEVKTL